MYDIQNLVFTIRSWVSKTEQVTYYSYQILINNESVIKINPSTMNIGLSGLIHHAIKVGKLPKPNKSKYNPIHFIKSISHSYEIKHVACKTKKELFLG